MEPAPTAPLLVHDAVFETARRQPSRCAIEGQDGARTYAELERDARDIAACLAAHGAGPERIVAVCLERRVELGAAVLGVLASGAAYLPIDPATPPERLRELVHSSGAILLLTTARQAERMPALEVRVLALDALPPERAQPAAAAPENLAYVLYTSGSTGKPKGVQVEHRSLAAHAHGMARVYALAPEDRVLQFASLAFDVAAEELFPTWCAGATVVLRDEVSASSFAAFTELLARREITVANLPAGFWSEWTSELARTKTELPTSLRLVIAGSERVPPASFALWKARFGERVRWVNGYGPTETTITATTYEPRAADVDASSACVPIGVALPWVTTHVLDEDLQAVAVGVAGQLAIGGAGVARGYLGAPELTAERFVPDPFSNEPGARLYLTGDRVRARADGVLEFQGRDDDQVKLRGYRIELGEIEAALAKLPGVRAAAVVLREDAPGVKQLVGYAASETGSALDAERLQRALAALLPEYMVPAEIVLVERFPRTPGGKVDRKALPAPERRARGGEPRGATEILLASLWRELLGLSSVGRDDNFFRLGGHSLLAMQLAGRLAERAQIELTPRAVFESPTLAALAAAIDSGSGDPWPPYPPMRSVDRTLPIPLSASQEPVWFLLQLEPGLLAYNTQFSVRFAGTVEPDALRRALTLLVARHEILRTTFHAVGEVPRQTIHDGFEPRLDVVDFSREPVTRREALAEATCARLCGRRFDVGALPLVEWTLLKHADDDWELVQVEHHFVHDGWSIALLLGDLTKLYTACVARRAPELPPAKHQFADYVAWQREMLTGARRERLVAFWRERLRGAPPLLALPTDRPRPSLQTFHGASEVLEIPPQLWRKLADLARREGFTPFQLLLTAFEILLARHSGQTDVVIATAAANRRTPEVEQVLGMLVNPVPIRVEVDGALTVREQAQRVRKSALESFEHQDLPFEHVVHAALPPRDFSYNPIFQVLFSFHDSPVPDLALGTAEGRMVYRYNGSAKFDMNLVVIPRGEQRVGRAHSDEDGHAIVEWEYNTDLFDREHVAAMVGHLRALLEGLETGFDAPCAKLDMLSNEEHAALARWNASDVPAPRASGLVDLFREQVLRTPDAVAATFAGERVTYREFARSVDALAAGLRSRGVARGDVVGVCLERSLTMLASLLAISACGAAYLPLDPALPAERLAYVVDDAFAHSARRFVIAERAQLERLPASLGAGGLDVATLLAASAPSAISDDVPARGDELAYVIYTSGSTGRPKGVEVTQANLTNFLGALRTRVPLAPGDVWLAVTTLSFDIAGLELFLPLVTGATVAIASREEASDAHHLAAALERERVTHLQATPATWRMLVESGWKPARPLVALCGGEALPLELGRELASRAARVLNLYGPTETTIWSSVDAVEPGAREITIGRPLDNTQLHVLGAGREVLPVGATGELWIGGSGVARGYRGRAELTAERFVPDPFTRAAGARMYGTGDLARRRADGRIEYLGRLDSQVKLRGFRIELGEIEAALRAHAGVSDAAVLLRELSAGDQRLVAWYVAAASASFTEDELRQTVARQLPEYMLPSVYVRLDALPRTQNGKLDRKALPSVAGSSRRGEVVPPRGEIELGVAEVWREVLQVEAVGARDRFFDLGGHSLLAMRALTRLEARFGVRVPARDLMLQNLAQLAAAIAERRRAREPVPAAAPAAEPSPGLFGTLRNLLGRRPS